MYGHRLQTNLQYPVVSARYNNERDLAPEDGQRFALDCDAAYGFPGVVIWTWETTCWPGLAGVLLAARLFHIRCRHRIPIEPGLSSDNAPRRRNIIADLIGKLDVLRVVLR